jgi:hypothetical protein
VRFPNLSSPQCSYTNEYNQLSTSGASHTEV